jgi:pimeloyl-ACP methyl ester carboxylesterase
MSLREVPRPAADWTSPLGTEVAGTTIGLRRGGVGQPVLVLHGHYGTRRWLPWYARLAEEVEVIAPEAPGFGSSPQQPWVRGLDDVVLVYRDLLDALGLERVHLVGYGLGGWLAADLAVWFPERVRSLALLAPYGLRVADAPLANVFLMNPAHFSDAYGLPGDAPDLVAGIVPGVATPVEGGPEEWAHRYGEMGAAARLMWQRRYDLALEVRLPRLARRGLPGLVVGGSQDKILPSAHLHRWAELLSASVVEIDGGHAFPFTAPDRTAEVVRAFVTGTPSNTEHD